MKKIILLFCFTFFFSFSQEKTSTYFDVQLFRGNVYKHTNDIGHLITGHPDGFLLSYNWKTFGKKEWQQVYNYPDYGVSYHYLDFKNQYLGVNHAIGVHYNFYFFKRQLMFRISQGIGMTSSPYDKETNNKNNAFGTKIMDNNYFLLQYKKENIIDKIGLQAGFMLTHFSNGRFKAPNSGINTIAFNLGLNYNLDEKQEIIVDSVAFPEGHESYTDPDTDYKRIGLFVGHELFINKLSIETQVGYYVYKPFDYEIDIYQRVGIKYYLYKKIFTGVGLKTHGGRAEAIEATVGV